jgi:hypothetical protein
VRAPGAKLTRYHLSVSSLGDRATLFGPARIAITGVRARTSRVTVGPVAAAATCGSGRRKARAVTRLREGYCGSVPFRLGD